MIQTRAVCARRNLQVHKHLGNKPEILRAFPPSECDVDVKNVKLCSSTERALGVLWSLKSDSFTYNYTIATEPWTRRTMLSAITSLNDSVDLMEICTVADSSTSDSRDRSYLRHIDKPNNAQVAPAIMNSDVIENLFSSQQRRCDSTNTNLTLSEYHHSDIRDIQCEQIVKKKECRHSGLRRRGTTMSYTSWENNMTR